MPCRQYESSKGKEKRLYDKKIFFLTDGGVGNSNAVVKLVKENAHKVKVHTFGI